MPAHCDPWPEYTKTVPGLHTPSWGPTSPIADWLAANAGSPATAWARSRADTVAKVLWCVRWWLSVWAASVSETAAPSPIIQSARVCAVDAIRAGDLPDTTKVVITGSGCGATGSGAGACSTITWALVPLTPKDDTPARRARRTAGQSMP